ncbi:MAG: HPr(Ser) kinase/phosphatase [Verrucomicrobiales bacterium]|nr:HPr(Ser) kinase/phosphatase [Verrucomicrobiales bacterium]
MAAKVKHTTFVTVGQFFNDRAKQLHLELLGSNSGFTRKILEPSVNRPGLALGGFFNYFPYKRVQLLGNSEMSYLDSLPEETALQHFNRMCEWEIPCVVVSRGKSLRRSMVKLADTAGISVFTTTMNTMKFLNAATLWLEWDFAPTTQEHGCMVDLRGIGVLIRGESGTGKSEAVLGLLERGHSLVADDIVLFRAPEGRELIGTSKEIGRFHMEIRGIGLVNVPMLFGVGAMRVEKRLDLVVSLERVENLHEVERVGAKQEYYNLLGVKVPHVRLPVAAGRDMARLVEVAALEQKLRSFGVNAATEFSKKLLNFMREKRIN